MSTTPKHGWTLPDGTDLIANGDDAIRSLGNAIDAVIATDDQGLLSARPTSTVGTPGIKGRYYFATDDTTMSPTGTLWRDNGTGWDPVGPTGVIPPRRVAQSGSWTHLNRSSMITIVDNGGPTDVPFDVEVTDTLGAHTGSAATLVAPVAGLYYAYGSVHWIEGGAYPGVRALYMLLNGTYVDRDYRSPQFPHNSGTLYISITNKVGMPLFLNVGDQVKLQAECGSAGVSQGISTDALTNFGMVLLGA